MTKCQKHWSLAKGRNNKESARCTTMVRMQSNPYGMAPAPFLLSQPAPHWRLFKWLLYAQTTSFGTGAIGDGKAKDTAAIQGAIDACAAQDGGVVDFEAGKTYLSGSLRLASKVTLNIEGVTLLASIQVRCGAGSRAWHTRIANRPANQRPHMP